VQFGELSGGNTNLTKAGADLVGSLARVAEGDTGENAPAATATATLPPPSAAAATQPADDAAVRKPLNLGSGKADLLDPFISDLDAQFTTIAEILGELGRTTERDAAAVREDLPHPGEQAVPFGQREVIPRDGGESQAARLHRGERAVEGHDMGGPEREAPGGIRLELRPRPGGGIGDRRASDPAAGGHRRRPFPALAEWCRARARAASAEGRSRQRPAGFPRAGRCEAWGRISRRRRRRAWP